MIWTCVSTVWVQIREDSRGQPESVLHSMVSKLNHSKLTYKWLCSEALAPRKLLVFWGLYNWPLTTSLYIFLHWFLSLKCLALLLPVWENTPLGLCIDTSLSLFRCNSESISHFFSALSLRCLDVMGSGSCFSIFVCLLVCLFLYVVTLLFWGGCSYLIQGRFWWVKWNQSNFSFTNN